MKVGETTNKNRNGYRYYGIYFELERELFNYNLRIPEYV
jgi:hypothetical protein